MPTVMTRPRVDIPALKAAHPLGDFVEASGVDLRGTGRVRQGLCPFHEETEGSFTVYSDTERWFCFGCGIGGDVLDFMQRAEGINLPEAIERLAGGQNPVSTGATRRGPSAHGRADPSRRGKTKAGRANGFAAAGRSRSDGCGTLLRRRAAQQPCGAGLPRLARRRRVSREAAGRRVLVRQGPRRRSGGSGLFAASGTRTPVF